MLLLRIQKLISHTGSKVILLVLAVTLIGNFVSPGNTTPSAKPSPNPTSGLSNTFSKQIESLATPNLTLPTISSEKIFVNAKSYIVFDNKTKYPLIAKDADVPVPIASTTKIMTALVALDQYQLDQIVTVTPKAAQIEGSEIQLLTGETVNVRNLLYALLLNSANDAAFALADATGSVDTFVTKMNEKASLLGLKNSHYSDPAGLDDTGRSTPRDLSLLLNYALDQKEFRTIITTPKTTIMSSDNKYKHDLETSNRLIDPDEPLYLPNAIGGKTGFTYDAGHCLIAAAEYPGGVRFVAAVLNTYEQSKEASAREARKLLVWAAKSL